MTLESLPQSKIEATIFVHDLQNPPTEDRSCDFEITVGNSKGRIVLEKRAAGPQTEYLLRIANAESLGVTVLHADVKELIKDLVLAFNLTLQRACVSTRGGDLFSPNVQTMMPETPAKVEHTPEGVHIHLTDNAVLRDSVHITMITKEEVDEDQLISHLDLVRKLRRYAITTAIPTSSTLHKALPEFESAMTDFSALMIFKHLFNSLALATNADGNDREFIILDKEIHRISGVPEYEAKEWREFYNRTKHIDEKAEHVAKFSQGLQDLPKMLPPLRKASMQVILNQLALLT